MADTDNLASTLTDNSDSTGGGLASSVASPPDIGANGPDVPSSAPNLSAPNQPAAQPAAPAPDLPRFQRTFGNTLKGLALGFALNGIPGAVAGAASPQGIQREAQSRATVAAANQHFASARAAHETAQAALLEKQVNAFDEEHQQSMEKIGLDNVKAAQEAGFKIVSVTPLDGDPADNAKAAMNNLQQIQKNNGGTVPEGLLHIHGGNGNGIFTMQLQDPAAALGMVNQTRRAQGLPELDSNTFMGLAATERQQMAKDAVNFTMPTDPKSGQISQDSVTTLENRLGLVKAQPAFNGQDALVANLQRSLDLQKSALEHEATRKGQATGTEAMAAQPGETEAERAKLGVLAGPEAAAAAQKAGAVAAAELPAKLALQNAEHGQDQGFAVNPKTGQRELVGKADAKEQGFTNWDKVGQTDIEKETQLNSQLNELQLNTSRYKAALQTMGQLSQQDVNHMARILSDSDVHSGLANNLGMASLTSIIEKGARAKDWNELTSDKQEALMGALRMRNSALLFQKVATGMGRASKEAMDIELQNMPDPYEGATVGLKKLGVFQENVDQMAARSVKLPWMETSKDVKARIEGQATEAFNEKQAETKPKATEKRRPVSVGESQ